MPDAIKISWKRVGTQEYGHIHADDVVKHEALKRQLGKTVAEFGHHTHGVRLFQNKNKSRSFSVLYFLELHHGTTYAEAAKRFGEAVMHYQACSGILDNERD